MYSCEPVPVRRRYWIPSSHLGIEWTVEHMRELAQQGARSPIVQQAAEAIVGESSGKPAALAIRRYLADRMVFQFDPEGLELIRTPELLVRQIECHGTAVGDCDDVATLGAALGMAVGLRAVYVLLAFHLARPFEHVYTELVTPSGPVELDTTKPAQFPPGLEIRRTTRRDVAMYGPQGLGAVDWGSLPGMISEASATPPSSSGSWWEEPLSQVATAAADYVSSQFPSSTSPYGPGYFPPGSVAPEPTYAEPASSPGGMSSANALLLAAVGVAGLKLAGAI